MLINGILNVAIGIVMTFGTVSLVTSAITEAISSALALRSKTLLGGVKKLLNDPNATGLALAVYQHAAVNPLGSGSVPPAGNVWQNAGGSYRAVSDLLGAMPSYVEANGFASALIDAIQNRQQPNGFIYDINQAIVQIQDPQLKAVITGIYERAGRDVGKLHTSVAAWFDAAMDRLSGDYKRRSQLIGLIIAGFLVILLNIDAVSIARHVYADPAMVQHSQMTQYDDPAVMLRAWSKTFPFGWSDFSTTVSSSNYCWAIFWALPGWIITTLATLFGAPFWFDTLQRFVQIRGTGPEAGADATKPRA